MKKIIIGIHGLKNKVERKTLEKWWELSIREGFKEIGISNISFELKLMYWADLLYPYPLNSLLTNEYDPRFCVFPYKKVNFAQSGKQYRFRQRTLDGIEKVTDTLLHSNTFYNSLEGFTSRFIRKKFRDLDVYFNHATGYRQAQTRPVREVILHRMKKLIHQHRHDQIMIIGHSMGSIIAYDFLKKYESEYNIDTLLTIGSPLGQPTIVSKFVGENPAFQEIYTPENINFWYNLSDLSDVIAINYAIADDYAANSKGIQPIDMLIQNCYIWEGVPNAHSVYGYLQTAEAARIIYDFLKKDKSVLGFKLLQWLQVFREKLFNHTERLYEKNKPRPETPPKKFKAKEETLEEKMDRQVQS